MKITLNNYQTTVQTPQKKGLKPSFKGGALTVGEMFTRGNIKFFEAIERGGFAANFTLNDMLGTNFPRAFQASGRGREQTGKRNWKATGEVVIREFVTGPSMFLVPALVVGVGKKLVGSANAVPVKSIKELSRIMADVTNDGNAKNIKKAFYEKTIQNIGEHTYGKKLDSTVVENCVKSLIASETAPKRNFLQIMFSKKLTRKAVDQCFDDVASALVKEGRKHKNYAADFTTVKFGANMPEINVSDAVKQIRNYGDDATKFAIKNKNKFANMSQLIENFKNNRAATRFLTNPIALVATTAFLMAIPKLYSFNKVNPETEALYAELNTGQQGGGK
ncbi:hypothetical protein tpqmel_0886 [Candidatus Gastranaerophilus sp. (ex Termes propinquus)]|nr:hypothetical protein tpqmel_0886 [Candidatus Gastranaerophilus sp. (ex Termes propinquus)]